MSICEQCNLRIENPDLCLLHDRLNPVEVEYLKIVLQTGHCNDFVNIEVVKGDE